MKNLFKTLMVVLAIFISTSLKAQFISAELTASGLTCSMCSKAIYKALSKLSFIEKVDVDINKSIYKIQFKDKSNISFDEIKKTVEDAGFSVATLKVKAQLKDIEVFNDAHVRLNGSNLHFINVDKKKLNGTIDLTIVDKGFTSEKNNAKHGKYTTLHCFKTGKMAACCSIKKDGKTERIYHVTL